MSRVFEAEPRSPVVRGRGEPRRGPLVSVIVPVAERPEPLGDLYREYSAPLRDAGLEFEFLFITTPGYDAMVRPLRDLAAAGEPVRVCSVGQTLGEGSLLKLGARACRGEILVTLPAYRRVEPEALPRLVRRVENGIDIAVARRWPRRDPWINRLQSRAFHFLLRGFARGGLHDIACGVRAMRRDALIDLPLYGDFSRFLPLLAMREGYEVEEVACRQHAKDTGARIYQPGVYVRRLLDLLGIFFLLRFIEKPLRFFGLVGSALSALGALVLLALTIQRFQGQPLADRPMLLLGLLVLVLGVQAIALGLVGEIIVHLNAPSRRPYRLREERPGPRANRKIEA